MLLLLALPLLVIAHRLTRDAHLAHFAQVDSKTGLHNSRHFESALEEELAHSHRVRRPVAVMFADLDHFKRVNDEHGHAAGDRVLREVASILTEVLRKGDTIARFGGEEFVALLPGADPEEATYLAERVRAAVEAAEFEVAPGTSVRCTISVGLAFAPQNGNEVAELLRQADMAMYRATRLLIPSRFLGCKLPSHPCAGRMCSPQVRRSGRRGPLGQCCGLSSLAPLPSSSRA